MSGAWPPAQEQPQAPCPKCTGRGDAHYLTCPTLRLRRPVSLLEASDVMNRRLADAAAAGMSVREAVRSWADVPP